MRRGILPAISGRTEWEESARLKLSPSGAARSGLAGRKDAGRTFKPEVSIAITVAWRRAQMVRFKSVESITETFVGTPFTVCDAVGTLLAISWEAEGEESERLKLSPMGAARSGLAGRKDARIYICFNAINQGIASETKPL